MRVGLTGHAENVDVDKERDDKSKFRVFDLRNYKNRVFVFVFVFYERMKLTEDEI